MHILIGGFYWEDQKVKVSSSLLRIADLVLMSIEISRKIAITHGYRGIRYLAEGLGDIPEAHRTVLVDIGILGLQRIGIQGLAQKSIILLSQAVLFQSLVFGLPYRTILVIEEGVGLFHPLWVEIAVLVFEVVGEFIDDPLSETHVIEFLFCKTKPDRRDVL